eukprot:919940-Amphidinium_carterae.1
MQLAQPSSGPSLGSGYGFDPPCLSTQPVHHASAVVGDVGDLRKDTGQLPKLQVQYNMSSIEIIHEVQKWLTNMSFCLCTWAPNAPTWWSNIVAVARKEHEDWCSKSAQERVALRGLTQSFGLPKQVAMFEGALRADVLRGDVLPKSVRTACALQRTDTVQDIIHLLFREVLPSENNSRLEAHRDLDKPVKAAKTFREAISTVRQYAHNLRAHWGIAWST